MWRCKPGGRKEEEEEASEMQAMVKGLMRGIFIVLYKRT
jgi:hypothetical protein